LRQRGGCGPRELLHEEIGRTAQTAEEIHDLFAALGS
jgi:hypothetical protein